MWPFGTAKKNSRFTSTDTILKQLQERRPLPLGVKDFHEWSDRIISGACLNGVTPRSQKFALAEMILHLGPTESHKEDAFFIHSLRKSAVNQVADEMRRRIRDDAKAELAKQEETQKKLAIEKRHEDQMAGWSQEEKDEFIHNIYLQENKVVSISTQSETPAAATASTQGAADAKASEKPGT